MADSKTYQFLDRGEEGSLGAAARKILLGSLLESLLVPVEQTGITVYANESTDEIPGTVTSVYATVGGTAGPKDIVPAAALAALGSSLSAGECSVAYAADGKATITFAAADAVTLAAVVRSGRAASYEALEDLLHSLG